MHPRCVHDSVLNKFTGLLTYFTNSYIALTYTKHLSTLTMHLQLCVLTLLFIRSVKVPHQESPPSSIIHRAQLNDLHKNISIQLSDVSIYSI